MAKAKKAKQPKAKAKKDHVPTIGHNSGGLLNKEVVKILVRVEQHEENKKQISKAIRDDVAKLKTEFGILSSVAKHVLKMRKLDADVRAQFEAGVNDLNVMVGYQHQLPLDEAAMAQGEEEGSDATPEAEEEETASGDAEEAA